MPNEPLDVLHLDNHLLVVRKPAGLPVQRDESGDRSLLDVARAWLKLEFDKPGNVFVGLVHRLDRPVEGVVILARTSKGASRLSAQFRERRIEKTYLTVVSGRPDPPSRRLEESLSGKSAILEFDTLRKAKGTTLLEVRPLTGRKHQIRKQLAAAGHPILGDLRYGATAPLPARRIALFARAIGFEHPTLKTPLRIECPLPGWWPLAPLKT